MADADVRVGLLWRSEWDPVAAAGNVRETCRLRGMFSAFEALGVQAEPVVYSDSSRDAVREQLLELDGVLVWVNPIEQGHDRSQLDPLLREVGDHGVWVSAHPDVIARMATKEVLVDTAGMSWSAPTRLYRSHEQLRSELPARLGRRPLVLKQRWGMGGIGVWKVERAADDRLRVQHAASGSLPEAVALDEFVERCEQYFANGGLMVEQPFQARLAEGMIRVYLSHDEVVGFAHQYPRGLLDPELAANLPTEKRFGLPSEARFEPLRERMEEHWVGELRGIVGVERDSLPVIWDADFLYADKTDNGGDEYVLCEINASSTFAFPEHAMPVVARAALDRIADFQPRQWVKMIGE
jgi:hypothetical protein